MVAAAVVEASIHFRPAGRTNLLSRFQLAGEVSQTSPVFVFRGDELPFLTTRALSYTHFRRELIRVNRRLKMTAEIPTVEQQLDQIISDMGTLEVRGSQRRIYFDNLEGWLELDIERDDSGNIVSATRSGTLIIPSVAILTENQLKHARLYYDLDERVFRGQGLNSINKSDLAAAITRRAKEILAEQAFGDQESNEEPPEANG